MSAVPTMDRKQWLEWRRGGIGSSDAAKIMNVSPYGTPYTCWKEKVFSMPETPMNYAMQKGVEMEPIIRAQIENELCILLEPKNVVHPIYSWKRASLDAISLDGQHVFEIKDASKENHELARKGIVPVEYYPQCVHQIECTSLPFVTYVSHNKGENIYLKVDRDEEYLTKLRIEENIFWEYVVNRIPPPKTGRDYEERESDHVDLIERWKLAYEDKKIAEEKFKEAEEIEQKLKEEIIEVSGGINTIYNGAKLTRIDSDGRIDYDKAITDYIVKIKGLMPDAPELDVTQYRKAPIVKFRLSLF